MLKQLSTLAIAALAALSVGAQSVETVPYTASSAVFCNPERGIFTHQEFHSGDNYALSDQLVSRCRQEGISLVEPAANDLTGIAAPQASSLFPVTSTYDLLGRKTCSTRGITISQGRKIMR